MDFKQMFDDEELTIVLNVLYEAGVRNNLFAVLHYANYFIKFAVKTSTGLTEYRNIKNKVMQGDVISRILSSKRADKKIGKVGIIGRNAYIFKKLS